MATARKKPAAALLGGQVVTNPGHADLSAHGVTDVVDKLAAPDFSGVAVPPSVEALELLRTMANQLRELLTTAAEAQEAADVANAALSKYQMFTMPEAMEQAGLTEFKLDDGAKLAVKPDLKVGISEANRAAAHAWLRAHGHGSVIKTILEIDVRTLSEIKLEALEKKIVAAGVDPEHKESVHNATLKSLVKEILEAGTTLPPAFSVHQFKKAELKEPKAK